MGGKQLGDFASVVCNFFDLESTPASFSVPPRRLKDFYGFFEEVLLPFEVPALQLYPKMERNKTGSLYKNN